MKSEIQQEPILQKVVEKVRNQVINNPKIDREVTQKVDQALKETISLQKIGQEPVGQGEAATSINESRNRTKTN